MSFMMLCGTSVGYAQKQKGNVPLVYTVENTGSQFAAPKMPTIDKLPVIRELPDPLKWSNGKGKVQNFKDWSKRRSEISNQIQHYGIGTKPTVPEGAVKAKMSGDTLIVDVTVNGQTLTLSSTISYPKVGNPPYALMIGTSMLALPRQLFADRPIAIMNYREKQVNDYGQMGRHHERGEHNFDRLYPDVSGCSYAGKMALYCGAFDERIALTIAQEPGGGGAAAWRASHELTLKGKNLEDLDKTDYHWFMESQKENFHGDSVYRLPYDQHELCTMVCPRALLLLGNPDYEWLADGSMVVSAKAAKEVWKFFGIDDRFGYSIVEGHGHCQLPERQFPEVQAFIDKFLLGKETNTKDIQVVSGIK